MDVCYCFTRKSRNKSEKDKRPKKASRDSKGTNESSFSTSNAKVDWESVRPKELAATRIQTAYRAYKARKRLYYLKGASRFHALVSADALTKQASVAFYRIHFWSKIQADITPRRLCTVTEGQLRQMKLDSRLHELQVEWCGGHKAKKITLSKSREREQAAKKRERAMAYAFCHQWRPKSNRYFGQAYYDLSKERWGWRWQERWIPICRSETHVVARPVVKGTPDGKRKRYN